MKKTLIAAACVMASLSALAQGTVNFNNSAGAIGGTGAPVFDVDGTTRLGAGFLAQLYAGPVGGSLAPIGVALPFRTSGAGLGFINTTGVDTSRAIATVLPGANADVQIRAWASSGGAATYEAAVAAGALFGLSPVLTLKTGGDGSPAALPANLVGLQSFNLVVPEPSTIALGLLGAAALLIRRRK